MKLGLAMAALSTLLITACSDDPVRTGIASGAGGDASGPTGSGGASDGGGGGTGGSAGGAETSKCLGTESTDDKFSQALQVLRDSVEKDGVPGAAIAIIEDGRLTNIGVVGSKSAADCDPITPDTLFHTVFASHLLTTIAALDAVEDGKLSLTEPITNFVPTLWVSNAADVDQIRLHHLLTETSMYSAVSSNPASDGCTGLAQIVADAQNPVLQGVPGSIQGWNKSNYEIAGLALENVDGKPFLDAVTERVLAPLAMGGSFEQGPVLAADHSLGHSQLGVDEPVAPTCPNKAPSEGYRGSIRDMAKLAEYIAGGSGEVLEASTREQMLAEQGPHFLSDYHTAYGADAIGDSVWVGSYGYGFAEEVLLLKRSRFAVVTLMNASYGRPAAVNEIIVGQIYDDVSFPSPAYDPDPNTFPSLVGIYVDNLGFNGSAQRKLEVTLDPNDSEVLRATVETSGDSPLSLLFDGYACADNFVATFEGTSDSFYLRFWRDDAGNGSAVSIDGYNGPPFFRIP